MAENQSTSNEMTRGNEMIHAENLSKFYGNFAAISDVSFSVPQNQVCAFLGPNGAGKSTTMKLLTGYLAPSKGTVRVAGYDMESQRLSASSRIGYLPENGPLYNEMTPAGALKYLGRVRGLTRNRLRDRMDFVCAKCNLQEVWMKPIAKLSRGFRQRVGMAQAILHDPEVLILDEPTSGLDPNQLVGIRQLIKDLGETKTVLLSTHILQEVEYVCTRVILVNEGRLAFDGDMNSMTADSGMQSKFHQLTGFASAT